MGEEILTVVVHGHAIDGHLLRHGDVLVADFADSGGEDLVCLPDGEGGHLEAYTYAEGGDLD